MAEHSLGTRRGAGSLFRRAISDYRKRRRYRDPQLQNALHYYKGHPERSQRVLKGGELGHLERYLLDDAQRPNATGSPQWELKKHIGGGGYGKVWLWERNMGPQKVHEPLRIACKETEWDSFFKDLCEEAHVTQKLNGVSCVNVVKVIDWIVYPEQKKTKILYEYCPHGTLDDVRKFYQQHLIPTIPEAFIWHVFHSLASALCYCAHGTTAEEGIADWEAIIHRDIKPANVLLAEPDLNNRPLYPTIKLADYGLAYSVHSEDVRNLKAQMWSGGTLPYAAPEVMSTVRGDPNQTPHEKAYSESDVFSVGCIILQMMQMSLGRYHTRSEQVLDHDFPFRYQSIPYSDTLRNLAMDCVKNDVRSRPLVREVYKRSKYYADLWYGKVSGPSLAKPQEAYAGQALWNSDLRNRFETDMHFRWNHIIHNDWFHNHRATVAKVHRVATDPGKANVPRDHEVLAIGNGMERRDVLVASMSLNPNPELIEERLLYFFNREGKLMKRRDGKPVRRLSRPQLQAPILDENWRTRRIENLDRLIGIAEGDSLNLFAREIAGLKADLSEHPTFAQLTDFRKLQRRAISDQYSERIIHVMAEFAEEMIAYLEGKTDTKPQYTAILPAPNLES